MKRLSLFESDLVLLGLTIGRAAELDEKTLRQAFRRRSRELHPDARVGSEGDRVTTTVYELNAAYEALRKLL